MEFQNSPSNELTSENLRNAEGEKTNQPSITFKFLKEYVNSNSLIQNLKTKSSKVHSIMRNRASTSYMPTSGGYETDDSLRSVDIGQLSRQGNRSSTMGTRPRSRTSFFQRYRDQFGISSLLSMVRDSEDSKNVHKI
mmetsp:Transcript_39207/g.44644  ORF Transcript_39207/g.44644 Transcript_39207/m.44644 type:complete len:137 (+) Transcript_39207:154-564(+)